MRIVAIEDGFFYPDPTQTFVGWEWDAVLEPTAGAQPDRTLRFSLGCFLVEGSFGLLLIDTGAGPNENSPDRFESGHLESELATIGVGADNITAVIHTHLHFDHWGGDLTVDGAAAWPNATIFVAETELEYWRDKDPVRDGFLSLSDHVATVSNASEPFPGIRTVPTPGHTPGHVSVEVVGEHDTVFVLGDVAHHPEQLRHPDWGVRFDVDGAMASTTRIAVFDALTDSNTVMAGGHWPRPGWGHVVSRSGGTQWEPVS